MTKSRNNNFIASIVRYASLALFIAIALRTMGIANEIVELAFGLILGALAVAFALSYGLGGREAAGEHFKEVIQKFKNDKSTSSTNSGIGSESTTIPEKPRRNINDPANPNHPDDSLDPSDPRNPNRPQDPNDPRLDI